MTANIHFISAGAGSGKTYTLTEKLEDLLGSGEVSPAGVIATTFTRLAAGELKERVRQKLIESGELGTANQMEQSLIGTVNGVCGELLRRFAFEVGLPPDQTVLEEVQGDILFYQGMEQAMAGNTTLMREMNELCHRLQITDGRTKQLLWRQEVKKIVDNARANNQSSEDIRDLGTSSAASLTAYFPTSSSRNLNQELLQAVSQALDGIDLDSDKTKGTATYYNLLRGVQAALVKNRLTWAEWIKLSKDSTKPTQKSESWAEPIRDIASQYEKHPQLRVDIEAFALRAFQIAAVSLDAYQQLKTRKGLVDFVDQEQQLYKLLDHASVAETLQDELQLLMVDEFQDTSPIQLALFLKLAKLADQVIWVGDIKQSIYGFRGADPALMSAVVERVIEDGNPPQILEKSWRSRPELVEYVNALFEPAFSNTLEVEQVHLIPAREAISSEPAVECWQLTDSNKAKRAGGLSSGIGKLMRSKRIVIDKDSNEGRPLAFSDIAVLCRTHNNLAEIATALANNNLPIRYKRPGLLSTPEGCLAMACLRLLIDPLDTLASAEIITLSKCENPDSWITQRLEFLADDQNLSHLWLTDVVDGPVAKLAAQRQRLPFLTPAETLRVALDAGEVRKAAYSWGPTLQRAQHRLNNLSTLVTHAENYINQCASQKEPAGAAGLVLWLQALAYAEEDTQATGGDEDAIQLVTHHGAKGLEWPIVIAMDMDTKLRPRMWGLTVQASSKKIDLDNPLEGRVLRYWPSFQGAQRSDIPLVTQIENSDEGQAVLNCIQI